MTDTRWDKIAAQWYDEALKYSDYPDKVLTVVKPLARGADSLLDIGAGTGALCIPLADTVRRVVALDSSPDMLRQLMTNTSSLNVGNVEPVEGTWEESEESLGLFDIILCANVPDLLSNIPAVISSLQIHCRRCIFLICGVTENENRFYFRDLWPLIFQRDYPAKPGFSAIEHALGECKISHQIAIIDYNFDQPFVDIKEAVLFWKHYLRLDDHQWDDILREFLLERLLWWGGRLWAVVRKKSAVIWWRPKPGI